MPWNIGDRFVAKDVKGYWTVQDFDTDSGTVLGYHDDGQSRIFFLNQIQRITEAA